MSAATICSAEYWRDRYAAGGTSGAGSYGHLARYKAAFLNGFVAENTVADVVDLGCGDGHLLSLLSFPAYLGVDVSPAALDLCRTVTAGRPGHRFAVYDDPAAMTSADLALSIDVLFHLVEDAVYAAYLDRLFTSARRFVVLYASNRDQAWPAPHVRHRHFTERVRRSYPDWRLAAHVLNPYPFDRERPDETSFADFFVYARGGTGCRVVLPGT